MSKGIAGVTATQKLTAAVQALLTNGEDPEGIQTGTCMVSTADMRVLKELLPAARSEAMKSLLAA